MDGWMGRWVGEDRERYIERERKKERERERKKEREREREREREQGGWKLITIRKGVLSNQVTK